MSLLPPECKLLWLEESHVPLRLGSHATLNDILIIAHGFRLFVLLPSGGKKEKNVGNGAVQHFMVTCLQPHGPKQLLMLISLSLCYSCVGKVTALYNTGGFAISHRVRSFLGGTP